LQDSILSGLFIVDAFRYEPPSAHPRRTCTHHCYPWFGAGVCRANAQQVLLC